MFFNLCIDRATHYTELYQMIQALLNGIDRTIYDIELYGADDWGAADGSNLAVSLRSIVYDFWN